jgi:two-component system, cell cycle response regulator
MPQLASSRRAAVGLLVLTAVFALCAIEYTFHPSGELRHVVDDWVYDNVMLAAGVSCVVRAIRMRDERLAWILMGTAVIAWGIGDTVWTFTVASLAEPPSPSYADAGFLALYPPAYVAIVLLLRARVHHIRASLWLDGVIGGLGVAAVGTAVVFEAVLRTIGGSRAAVATNLAYPLADLTLVALVVWSLAATGWRPGRTWGLITLGLLVFSVSDCLYLYETAAGSYVDGTPTDLGWIAGGVLVAWAAWQPRTELRRRAIEGWPLAAAPIAFGALGLGVLVYDHVHRVNALALVLASATILAVIARMGLTFAENMRMIASSRHEARTDPLTGLGNRRRLLDDLEAALADGRHAFLLALFDLNGFKHYNDTFGHPAGDALLMRLGESLGSFMAGSGRAYRLGGDEFCILMPSGDAPDETVAGATDALAAHGEGFAITAAHGEALLPAEAATPTAAFSLADRRLYANKEGARASASEQSSGVLLQALVERSPRLGAHVAEVADLAEAVAIKLGLGRADVARARLAATMHDIGKMAIPDALLDKPTPLTEDEWAFVRGHTLIGERILLAAPALAHVAPLVRSSHERFDGTGYPDGIGGVEVPLVSRIIFVCDAFDAMTSQRPHIDAMTIGDALAELVRKSGTQFDPVVVEAFTEMVADRGARRIALAS